MQEVGGNNIMRINKIKELFKDELECGDDFIKTFFSIHTDWCSHYPNIQRSYRRVPAKVNRILDQIDPNFFTNSKTSEESIRKYARQFKPAYYEYLKLKFDC